VKKDGSTIEIKEDLGRFEDPFLDFRKANFAGLGVSVMAFTPYCMYDST
jgi:hypothetical protein